MNDPDLNQINFDLEFYPLPSFLQLNNENHHGSTPPTLLLTGIQEAFVPESQPQYHLHLAQNPALLSANAATVAVHQEPQNGTAAVAVTPGEMGPPPKSRKRKAPTLTEEDWQPYKDEIIRLYVDEDMPLHRVMEAMENEHEFVAGKRQYETILKKWDMRKNCKTKEMKAIVRKSIKRKLVEVDKKPLECTVRNRVIKQEQIDRFMKLHRIPSSILYTSPSSKPTPAAVNYRTVSSQGTPAESPYTSVRVPASLAAGYSPAAQTLVPPSPAMSDMSILHSDVNFVGESPCPIMPPHHWTIFAVSSGPEIEQSSLDDLMVTLLISEESHPPENEDGDDCRYKSEEEAILSDAWATNKMIHGSQSPTTMRTALDLAQTFVDQGRYRKAEHTIRESLVSCRRFSLTDETVVETWRLFGEILHCEGRYSQSKKLLEKLLHLVTSSSAPRSDCTGRIRANLALTLGGLGLYESAEGMIRQAIDISHIAGSNVEESCNHMRRLSRILSERGRWQEALDTAGEAAVTCMEALGPVHPESLACKDEQAWALSTLAKWEDAKSLALQAFEASAKIRGTEHPSTIEIAATLSGLYSQMGSLNDSEKLGRWVAQAQKKVLGPEHPTTIISLGAVGNTLRQLDRLEEAAAIYEEAIGRSTSVLGKEHPLTMNALMGLSCVLGSQGKIDESRELNMRILGWSRQFWGEEHPTTIWALHNICPTDQEEEWNNITKAVTAANRVFGSEHPTTLYLKVAQVRLLNQRGYPTRAVDLARDVVKKGVEVRGEGHPDTIYSIHYLGIALGRSGQVEEAVRILSRGLELSENTLGSRHQQSKRLKYDLEYWRIKSRSA